MLGAAALALVLLLVASQFGGGTGDIEATPGVSAQPSAGAPSGAAASQPASSGVAPSAAKAAKMAWPGGAVLTPPDLPTTGPGIDTPGAHVTFALDDDGRSIDSYELVRREEPSSAPLYLSVPSLPRTPQPAVANLQVELDGVLTPATPNPDGGWIVTSANNTPFTTAVVRYKLTSATLVSRPGRGDSIVVALSGRAAEAIDQPRQRAVADRDVGREPDREPERAAVGARQRAQHDDDLDPLEHHGGLGPQVAARDRRGPGLGREHADLERPVEQRDPAQRHGVDADELADREHLDGPQRRGQLGADDRRDRALAAVEQALPDREPPGARRRGEILERADQRRRRDRAGRRRRDRPGRGAGRGPRRAGADLDRRHRAASTHTTVASSSATTHSVHATTLAVMPRVTASASGLLAVPLATTSDAMPQPYIHTRKPARAAYTARSGRGSIRRPTCGRRPGWRWAWRTW